MASESTHGSTAGQQRMGETMSGVRETAQNVASSVAETAEQAWDQTRRAATSVAETAGTAWDDLTGLMSRYPFATLFVGIGVGICLSRLIEARGTDRMRRVGSDLYDRARDYASDVASRFESRTGQPLT
jgi:hypothetical protein